MSKFELTKADGTRAYTPPGTWRKMDVSAMFRCPSCKELRSLVQWTIAADGSVSPSFFCKMPTPDGGSCGFHELLVLNGWGDA